MDSSAGSTSVLLRDLTFMALLPDPVVFFMLFINMVICLQPTSIPYYRHGLLYGKRSLDHPWQRLLLRPRVSATRQAQNRSARSDYSIAPHGIVKLQQASLRLQSPKSCRPSSEDQRRPLRARRLRYMEIS